MSRDDQGPEAARDAARVLEVDALRQDAEELRRARLLLERAEDMAGIGSWEFDFATRKVVGSPGALKIYGAPPAIGLRIEDMERVPLPEYRPLLDKARDDHILRGLPYDVEFKIRRMNDDAILDVHSRASYDAAHKRLFGIIKDITKEKKAEAEILALNRDLEARVAERTRQLSVANDSLTKVLAELEASHAQQVLAEKMAALGRLVALLAHELNTPIGAIRSESESGLRDAKDLAARLERVRALDADDFAALVALVGQAAPAAVLGDIQERRQLRRYVQRRLEEADCRDASVAADELADMVLGGDIEGILVSRDGPSFAAVVHLAWELTAEGRADAVIRAAGEKAERVVRTLHSYVAGGLGQKIETVDLRSSIEGALASQTARTGHGIGVECSWGGATKVFCFPEQLEQAWINLISNAIDAMGRSGTLRIETSREETEAIVSLIDDGPGIPDEIKGKIFTPFFSTKPPGLGTGLGLDITRRIVEEAGGKIDFVSRPGRTCFTVRLKAAD